MKSLLRFWFILPIFLIIIVVQTGFGFNGADNAAAMPTVSATLRPTFTPTFTPTPTPTRTLPPSPTATPVIEATPTDTVEPTMEPLPTDTVSSPPTIAAQTIEPVTPTIEPSPPELLPLPTATETPIIEPTPIALAPGTSRVPILMYHYLSAPPFGADAIRTDLSVSPDLFDTHLAYLQEAGYESISFQQLAVALSRGEALPPKPVIITFDDGYRDSYENAFPVLQKYGYTATFFIFTQPIDTANVDFLSWDMVREMHQAGMEFGSHSHTHPDLRNRDVEFLLREIVTSKELIEQNIGEKIRAFAYPSGMYDETATRVVKSAGFWAAVTTQWGGHQSYDQRFTMPRVRIRGNDSSAMLAEKLRIVE
ncbi:MAG: polysaccharide deacetylase family protein [Anaerolineae bacterium]|nr:polysaccharide deacetylase family protein [Anaerolineae bacterium]